MKSLEAAEKEIIEEFGEFTDIDAKYAHLFKLGEELPPMDNSLKNEQTLVKGCQSKLWFHLYQEQGHFYLLADSDSLVIKGIAALLARLIHGRSAEEVGAIQMDFVDQLKLWKLASNRNNGLVAMLEHIHQQAAIISQQSEG
jgi:cysteine desulfuration protein SufE